jgi:hypothetical protein
MQSRRPKIVKKTSKLKPKRVQPATESIGRGHKVCPKCEQVVGARTKECECGHEFSPKVECWATCTKTMLGMLRKQAYTLAEIAALRKKRTHPGCLMHKCKLTNKQLLQLLSELVKSGRVKKEGLKYRAA